FASKSKRQITCETIRCHHAIILCVCTSNSELQLAQQSRRPLSLNERCRRIFLSVRQFATVPARSAGTRLDGSMTDTGYTRLRSMGSRYVPLTLLFAMLVSPMATEA